MRSIWKLLLPILLCLSEGRSEHCSAARKMEEECGQYCFKVVKPLLDYAASVRLKEQQFNEMAQKLQLQEEKIKGLESQRNENARLCLTKDELLAAYNQFVIHPQRNESQGVPLIVNIPEEAGLIEAPAERPPPRPPSISGFDGDINYVNVSSTKPFQISCPYRAHCPTWTVIQRRYDGRVSFYQPLSVYASGFGSSSGEFFMGLQKLHMLTQRVPHELYIFLINFNDQIRYARYSNFSIGGHAEKYKLKSLGTYSGNAGDALSWCLHMPFSTYDDKGKTGECARAVKSAWWFKDCSDSYLNGRYVQKDMAYQIGIGWSTWQTDSLKFVQMMIRPADR